MPVLYNYLSDIKIKVTIGWLLWLAALIITFAFDIYFYQPLLKSIFDSLAVANCLGTLLVLCSIKMYLNFTANTPCHEAQKEQIKTGQFIIRASLIIFLAQVLIFTMLLNFIKF